MPLERLYYFIIAEKAVEVKFMVSLFTRPALKLRFAAMPTGMKALTCSRRPMAVRLRAVVALVTFINLFDHIIDRGDLNPDDDADPHAHFEQASWLNHLLRNPEQMADEVAFPVLAGVIYAYRVCREVLDIDPTEQLERIWELYTPDAQRMLAGEPYADRETISMARHSYFECMILCLIIMGIPIDVAGRFVQLSQPLLYSDTFADFVYDLKHGNAQIPYEEFDEADINRDQLLTCTSWEELAMVPGFAEWFAKFAAQVEDQWLSARPLAVGTILPHVTSIAGRYFLWRRLTRMGRDLTEARGRFEILSDDEPARANLTVE